jgi:hypothetical protein
MLALPDVQELRMPVARFVVVVVALMTPAAVWSTPPNAFEAVHYRLEVTYDPAAYSIHGQVSVSAVWQGDQPLTALYFFLPPNTLSRRDPREPAAYSDLRYAKGFDAAHLTVHRITNPSQTALSFHLQDDPAVPVGHVPDRALLHIPLPRPYRAGEPLDLTISFTTRLPEVKNWGHYRTIMALDGRWYPMLVPYRQGQWVWGMQEFVHARYELQLTTPVDQHVIASVPWQHRIQHNGQQTLSGRAGPLYHLGLSSGPKRHIACDDAQRPILCMLAPPQDRQFAHRFVPLLRSILSFYHQQFALTLPTERFTIVVHERDLSRPFSASADNLLFLSRDLVRVPALVRKLAEFHIARGLAQQQWGLRTAYNLNTSRWIGEGLTTYFALRWLDHEYGPGRNFLTWKGAWLPNFSYRDQLVEVPYRRLAVQQQDQRLNTPSDATSDRDGLRLLREKKGALVYAMLHDVLGPDTFREFLRRLAREAPGGIITTRDVQQAAEAVSDQDLTWFFQQWVQQQAQLDYAVGQVEVTPQQRAQGSLLYVNRVEIHRLGNAIMPVTVHLRASDGRVEDRRIAGIAPTQILTWEHSAPLRDVQIDPGRRLPDVQRLNNTLEIAYTVRPLIDFPHLDRYLVYPFVNLENNFIDDNILRFNLIGRYLDDQAALLSIGYKETPDAISIEGQLWRQRFPHPDMTSFLSFRDRQGARTLALDTSLLLEESHQQHRLPANQFTLGYHVAFLEQQNTFQGEAVPATDFPSTGRLHSIVFRYQRDVRIPPAFGAPVNVLSEPLAYGYVLRLEAEIASEALGSSRPDFQQLRWEASEFLRLWNQTWLQLRVFGGWSAGTVPFQRKLTLAGIDTVRGYPYRLRFLGDRLLGGTVGLRLPIVRDMRLEEPGRYAGLRSVHIGPFIDAGWLWDIGEAIADTRLRSGAGMRLIAGIGFGSLFRFEIAIDIAYPLDAQGQDEDEGVQVWIRFQSTAGGGIH